ncbi:MAG TPA: mechanosensitive ion channel domain-containing protein [Stellaceae bacterium]|nr:mechanosensitive ion channel domain-containing protein [Stellaceae bacterium]
MKWRVFFRLVAIVMLNLAPLAGAAAQSAAPAATSANPPAPSVQQLQQLVATLKDDKARAQLVDELQALIAAQNAEQASAPSSPMAWLSSLPAQLDAVGGEVLATVPIVAQAPRIGAWLNEQIQDPRRRQGWIDVTTKLLAIFVAGIAADLLARRLLRAPARFLDARRSESLAVQVLLIAVAALVELLPVLIFAAVATFVIPLTGASKITDGVAGVLITATVWARGFLAIARAAFLSPRTPLIYSLGDETREYLYIWTRRFAFWAAFAYALSVSAWYLRVPGAVEGLLTRLGVLVLAILAIIFVLQNRLAVADWLRGGGAEDIRWRAVRSRLGETWHILAITYVIGTFGVYLLNAQGGFALLLRATALSLVVISGAALLARFIEHALRKSFAVDPALKARFPHLETRANRYTAILTGTSVAAIYVLAALALLEAWGIGAFTWLVDVAQQPASRNLISMALVLIGGLVLWEFFSSMIERRLVGIDQASRSRARTVLPLLRSTVLVILVTVAILMILSQIGLNIAPLLAGAGIAGIAVGFGAQALVKDVITGFFMLLEDTFAVGDRVDVGGGHVGVIEAVSIRNFRLRDMQGVVHTVPFSAITTVLNMSRDFVYVLCDAGVVYKEDPDRVIEVMKEAGREFAAEPRWARCVLAPLEILGVDRFTDTAMVVRARIKAAPPHQLEMAREFNRILKKAFDRHGIEMASANQINYAKQILPAAEATPSATPAASD